MPCSFSAAEILSKAWRRLVADETKVVAFRLPADLIARLDELVPARERGKWMREAVEAKMKQDSAPSKFAMEARVEAVFAAIKKRGRATQQSIEADTGLPTLAVTAALRKLGGRVRWPDPGVVEAVL